MHQKLKLFKTAFVLLFILTGFIGFSKETNPSFKINNYYFQKNEGQLVGINGEKQNDILYIASQQGKSILLTKTGIAYQFVQFLNKDEKEGAKVRTHRVDVELVDANVNAKIEEVTLADGEVNFYAGGENDLTGIKSFKKIIYHDVYPNIDWVLKIDGENFKYDFVVKPGGDISKIKMKFNGEDGLKINSNGQLIIKTSLGDVVDEAPISYQDNEEINTEYILNDHILTFKAGNYNANKTIILDPSIAWSTYFGGVGDENVTDLTTDISGNVYICGSTTSSTLIASLGAHQTTYIANLTDSYLAKFNSSGSKLWSTYIICDTLYITTDYLGNVIVGGYTKAIQGVATVGAHQSTFGGFVDGFLAKFDSFGVRQWSTYYGGVDDDQIIDVKTDPAGNIYCIGSTQSSNAIATPGSFQTTSGSSMLIKFNKNGVRIWGTYYGGFFKSLTISGLGSIYLAGYTYTNAGLTTVGAYQTTYNGSSDWFISKFNSDGTRVWSTLYGGTNWDYVNEIEIDKANPKNIYIVGYTQSNNLASVGALQTVNLGNFDLLITKFDTLGARQWATYYGGTNLEFEPSLTIDSVGNVYIAGYTQSTTGISTTNAMQTTINGNSDNFILKILPTGLRDWCSYLGGTSEELFCHISSYNLSYLYFASQTYSSVGISTSGSYQSTLQGATDSYLTKMQTGVCATTAAITGNSNICSASTQLTANAAFSYLWSTGATSQSISAIPGTYIVTITDSQGCVGIATKIVSSGSPVINSQPTNASYNKCNALPVSFTVTASGGTSLSYQWQILNGSVWVNLNTTSYPWAFGFATNTLTVANYTSTITSYSIRCVVTCGATTVNSSTATLSIIGNSITVQPINTTICVGFSSSLVANSTNGTSYNWYYKSPSSSVYSLVPTNTVFSGVNTNTLVLTSVTTTYNNYQFYCVVGGCGQSLNTNVALLTVSTFSINLQPVSQSICQGSSITFNASSSNSGSTYQWQYLSPIAGSVWTNVPSNVNFSGVTTPFLSVSSISVTYNNYQFRCKISDCGTSVLTTNSATLSVITPVITSNPSNVSTCPFSNVSFSVSTNSAIVNYNWQYSNNNITWSNCTNNGVFDGVNSQTLSLYSVPTSYSGYYFRCTISCGALSVTSQAAILTISNYIGSISGNTSYCSGSTGTTLTANTGSTYYWSNGQTTQSISAAVGPSSVTVTSSTGCVTNASTTVTAVTLPTITAQPTNTSVCVGSNANFSVNCNISNVQYQWQGKTATQTVWTNLSNGSSYSGVNTANLVVLAAPTSLNGYQYRCSATCLSSATSSIAVLTVKPSYSITINPQICPGSSYSFNGNTYTQPGTYNFQLTSSQGCDSLITMNLSYYPTNTSSIYINGGSVNTSQTSITLGDYLPLQLSTSLSVTNPNIIWTPNTNISSNSVANPLVNPSSGTQYIVSFNNSNGCLSRDTIVVNVTGNAIGTVNLTSPDPVVNYFDTLVVNVSFSNMNNLYSFYSKLKFNSNVSTYLTYIGYNQPGLLGSGGSIITSQPVITSSSYDFGVTKTGVQPGFNGNGTFYTFYFVVKNSASLPNGTQFCFYLDDFSIYNSSGVLQGVINGGQQCFNYLNSVNVWPGDLDNNKVVNATDLLRIGTFYNYSGPARANTSITWVAQPATLWGQDKSTANSSAYYVYADGNGDGIINNADQSSIGFNLGQSHPLVSQLDSLLYLEKIRNLNMSGSIIAIPTPPFVNTTQLPTTTSLSINLVNQGGSQLDSLNGISFSVEIDTNVYDLSNITYDYSNSIFGLVNVDFIKIEYVSGGLVNIALTRIGNGPINGNGSLCKILIPTWSSLPSTINNCSFNVNVDAASNPSGGQFTIPPQGTSIVVSPTASINDISNTNVQVSPNPFNESIVILNKSNNGNLMYKLMDAQGKIVMSGSTDSDSYRINTIELSSGVYFLTLINKSNQTQIIYKLVK